MANLARRSAAQPRRGGGGRADKHDAIMRSARIVFGREGYARASIDAIATEAGVSTRTIYNHVEGKEQLFSAILQASATEVAEGVEHALERRLGSGDLEVELLTLGEVFAAQRTDFPEHFALIAQIRAEAAHFSPAAIDAWREAGPRRIQRHVAERLAHLADQGLLHLPDPPRATAHFTALVTAEIPVAPFGSRAPTASATAAAVAAAVDAFLDGYRRRR